LDCGCILLLAKEKNGVCLPRPKDRTGRARLPTQTNAATTPVRTGFGTKPTIGGKLWSGIYWHGSDSASLRAVRRKEYWSFQLIFLLIYVPLYVVGLALRENQGGIGMLVMGLCVVWSLACFVPSLSCAVRRLHDIGKSGWWLLISLVPLVGGIILIVFLATDSEPGPNKYGPSPKLLEQPAAIG